ncbi:uncharacterized protein BO88DRAFT_419461 [Aspergillus vadensis CBS 113365]|uniref:BYS1 domain protein n=1 Tax=Aspergillus vadensis (strain CBS 113365 / IMI 142717 / IBT 24658) TaxID=1448311 RepID=A0A319BMT6_ASPVC|nr:hypothetical protein BO88DRAFT_419461 [Aspergillus vadensis CBS 113365]PYH64558.1 hypothetical protein BO88DRAFT_419461 [Aspergillus vadensis CBS 113365]
MRFLQTFLVAASIALYSPALAQELSGQGYIQVTSENGVEFLGCLTNSGQWDLSACAAVTARGGGQLVTQQGNYYTLTEALDITVTPDAGDAKYWSSTGYNSFGEPSNLEADGGVEHNGGGGPYWYAAAEPTEGAPVTLSAEESDGAQRVVLVWKSYY